MIHLYPFLLAFLFVFISELGDKTQLLVLSFSTKSKASFILLGVALGSLFSHGIAILFGSSMHLFGNDSFHSILQFVTYLSFILFGIFSFLPKPNKKESTSPKGLLSSISNMKLHYTFIIAISIAIGELGDKTFLASIGLGLEYPYSKFFLIAGSVLGMVVSDFLAILLGKLLATKIPERTLNILSGILFLLFGIVGLSSAFLF